MSKNPIQIDGKSISKSITGIIDTIRYRKYAKEGFITIFFISKENNTVKILDGKIDDSLISIRGIEKKYLIYKIYILPTKKLVTKCVFIKEDCNTTLDILHTDLSSLTPELLNKYSHIKIMEGFDSFNLGQVLLGALVGIIVGAVGMVILLMAYNAI